MAFNKGKPATVFADPILVEFEAGVFHFSDGTTAKLPDGIKYVEQDPEQPNMLGSGTKSVVKIIVKEGLEFFLVQGGTKQAVLDGIRRCERGV